MFAVIKTGGKQYTVAANDIITIERLEGNAGDTITFGEVLFVGGDNAKVGAPLVAGASVVGEIVEQVRGPKVINFKKKRRKGYHRKMGHRQELTRAVVKSIA